MSEQKLADCCRDSPKFRDSSFEHEAVIHVHEA